MNEIITYKVLNKDMTNGINRLFKYKLNEEYLKHSEENNYYSNEPFYSFLHMYQMIFDTAGYNTLKDYRFFKCKIEEPLYKILAPNGRINSTSITLIEEIPFEVVDKDIRDNIDKLIGLEIDSQERTIVAKQGYGLDKLTHDENEYVRRAVARQGYGLDILVNDKSELVRVAVAEQGYGLEILINDKSKSVRDTVKEIVLDRIVRRELDV